MTFSVFCQYRGVSSGLTRQNKESHFFYFLVISPIFFSISVSSNDQMDPFPMECHIYYYVIWTNNESRLLEADTRRQDGKYPMIKVLQGCILKLSLYLVNTVLFLYKTGNMQYFYHSSPLPPYHCVGFALLYQSVHSI